MHHSQTKQEKQYDLPYHWFMKPDSYRGRSYYGYVNYVLNLFNYNGTLVLDAGSGDGRFTSLLVNEGAKVIGIDYSKKAIDMASVMETEARFVLGSILDCSFEEKFDFIFLIEVLEHIEPSQVSDVLVNLRKSLKDNGKIIITFPSEGAPLIDKHFQHFNEDKIKKMSQQAHLKIEKIINFGFTNKFLNILYKILDNRFYDLKPLSKFFNKKIYPKFLLHPKGQQALRYIVVLSKQN